MSREFTDARQDAVKVARGLKDACRLVHEQQKGPGGAAVCICGMGCGGSPACSALGILRNYLRYGNVTSNKPEVQAFLSSLRDWL